MSDFIVFKEAVQKQFDKLSEDNLFTTNTSKDLLWETYLGSFPEGTNNIFRERTEHDCQCCKQFIRASASVVSIVNNELVSIWDVDVPEPYNTVAKALSKLVKSRPIKNQFFHYEHTVGKDYNNQLLDNDGLKKWEHFYNRLPNKVVMSKDRIDSTLGNSRSNKDVLKRGLDEITIEALNTVIDLIDQNSLYRGQEFKRGVAKFLVAKEVYVKLAESEKDNYTWNLSLVIGQGSKLRNTSIGTLLVDLSEGVDLDTAVKKFEKKVAPMNYKRPTALITKGMIDKAQKKVAELGIEGSLERRFANLDDITINNILFANRDIKKSMNIFDSLKDNVKESMGNFDKIESVDIEYFIEHILPKVDSVEVIFKNPNNLMSLVAPKHLEAKSIFKWGNNFSWSYNGDVTDSIKERVKKAGGNVTGALRCSLSWFNADDLDIHILEPNRNEIYYNDKYSRSSLGKLDVDMNAGGNHSRSAVENITWPKKERILEGDYKLFIRNYTKRESVDVGFDVEIEFDGKIYSFHYDKPVGIDANVTVATFNYTHKNGLVIKESLPTTESAKEYWGVKTNNFQKVSMIMNSPNHWDGHKTGNKHYFFILDKCVNSDTTRGFYNEFLDNDLNEHRKVFEVLASKMKVEKTDEQLSGVGFSSTQRNELLCRVKGSFSRTLKITF